MKNEEAIRRIKEFGLYHAIGDLPNSAKTVEVFNMAIEALKQPSNEIQLLDDGTLKVKVADVLDIKRVMVMDNNIIYDSYYPNRPKGKWILAALQNEDEIRNGNYFYECSNCNHMDLHAKEQEVPYCWYCGADMRGEEDG